MCVCVCLCNVCKHSNFLISVELLTINTHPRAQDLLISFYNIGEKQYIKRYVNQSSVNLGNQHAKKISSWHADANLY